MTRSTTYQWKILKTKKRLSSDPWSQAAIGVAVIALFAILTFGLRAVALSGIYGIVPAEIPVVPVSVNDPSFHNYKETPHTALRRSTPTVVLTTDAFYFGDLNAFTNNFSDVRDKFMIRHVDGEPQLASLIQTLESWATQRAHESKLPREDVLVFVPSGEIPMPIVIQVLAGLRQAPHFKRVIIGSGLI